MTGTAPTIQGMGTAPSIKNGWSYEKTNPPWYVPSSPPPVIPMTPNDSNPILPFVPWRKPHERRVNPMDFTGQTYSRPSFNSTDISVKLLVKGREVDVVYHKGLTYFVAPSTDATVPYTIQVSNNSGCRVAVVVSVDGLSVMTGKNASQNDTAYIIEPYGTADIKGWRRGNQEVAQFNFTSKGQSYAGLTDRPTNVGVIGVVAYPEKVVYPVKTATVMSFNSSGEYRPRGVGTLSCSKGVSGQSVGTGYGEYIQDCVTSVRFDRDYSRKAVLVYNYDSHDSLVDRGIIASCPPPSVPNAFPGDVRSDLFCPSPYRW